MPAEIIGEVGTPGADREWIVAQAELAIEQIVKTCGEPPPEMELEYPTIVLSWEDGMRGAPWEYIQKCQDALAVIDDGEMLPKWRLGSPDPEESEGESTLIL